MVIPRQCVSRWVEEPESMDNRTVTPSITENEKGFSLLETLAAIAVLAIFLPVVTSSFLVNLRSNMNAQIRYESIQAAQSVLDELRFEDISALLPEANPRDVTIGGRVFQVQVTYCENATFCPSPEIKHVSIDVSYRSDLIYETDTIFTEF